MRTACATLENNLRSSIKSTVIVALQSGSSHPLTNLFALIKPSDFSHAKATPFAAGPRVRSTAVFNIHCPIDSRVLGISVTLRANPRAPMPSEATSYAALALSHTARQTVSTTPSASFKYPVALLKISEKRLGCCGISLD